MVNKKDELSPAAKKKYTLSTSRASSVDKQLSSGSSHQGATGSSTGSPGRAGASSSSNSNGGRQKLGLAPKGSESPLKQALVIHHANVQQISVNWFKILSEQMEAIKRAESEAKESNEKEGEGKLHRSMTESTSNSPPSSDTVALSHHVIEAEHTEKAQFVSHSHLIQPKEVRISQHKIQEQPKVLLTPIEDAPEHLRRCDELLAQVKQDKKSILSLMFQRSMDEMEKLSTSILDNKTETPDSRTQVLAAMIQTDRLLDAINSNLALIQDPPSQKSTPKHRSVPKNEQAAPAVIQSADPPSVPCRQLALIVPPLLKHLSTLLQTIKHMEDELKTSRVELVRCKSEFGSVTSLARDSPGEKDRSAYSNRSSQSDDVRGTEGEEMIRSL